MLKLKGCVRCCGDLKSDGTDWQCLQCGHYYYDGITFDSEPKATAAGQRVPGTKWGAGPDVMNLAMRRAKAPAVASRRPTRARGSAVIPRA